MNVHSKKMEFKRACPVKVIAITAGKGGVGKTNVAINLALALARKKRKLLLLDADLSLANVDLMLGLEPKYNLSHVIQGFCRLEDILIEGPEGIKIIPAAAGLDYMTRLTSVEHAGVINAFNELSEDLDYMIIDTTAGISDMVLSFARSSQELIVLATDEPTALVNAYSLIKVMYKRFEWSHFRILGNMVRNAEEGQELFNKLLRLVEPFLDLRLDYLGALPFDERIHDAAKEQKPLLLAYPKSSAAKAFLELAEIVEGWPIKTLPGNTSFFLERLVAAAF